MPKGLRKPTDEMLLGSEGGGGSGGMRGGGGKLSREDIKGLALTFGPAGAVGPVAIGAGLVEARMNENRKKEKEIREAEAELKRESMRTSPGMKKGGMTASRRADGIAQRGKTRGKMV
jgi:hypothetical protein